MTVSRGWMRWAALGAALWAGAAAAQTGGAQGVYAAETRVGSPNSMPFQQAQVALDLFEVEPPSEAAADETLNTDDSDTIGGTFTYFDAGAQTGQRYDARYQRARRLGEGTRARVLIDVPVSVLHADRKVINFGGGFTFPIGGFTAVYGSLNGGVEIPVQPNWFITPRLSYANLQGPNRIGRDGEQIGGSVTSRLKIGSLGRGDFVLGNAIVYSHTIDTFLADQPFYADDDFWQFRNGIAYQLPLTQRMFGRQTSIRASYVYTYLTGVAGGGAFVGFKNTHEFGVSFGIRAREVEQKNRFEQLRVGLLYTHAKNEFSGEADYDGFTLTVGYRF